MNVSIIITAHKDRGFLAEAIKSAKTQKFSGTYEIILASDHSREVEKIGGLHNLIVNQNKYSSGFSSNFNSASEIATGKYLKVLADDDLLLPNCIQVLYNKLEQTGKHIVHANALMFAKNKQPIKYMPKIKDPNLENLTRKNTIHGGTIMYSREMFNQLGGYDTGLLVAEEYDLYLRLLKNGYSFAYCNALVYKYRIHRRQKGKTSNTKRRVIKGIVKKYL